MNGGEGRKETLADKPLDFENRPHANRDVMLSSISQLNLRPSAEEVNFEPKQTLQSKQVKRSSHEWINKFIFPNLISVVISIIRSSDK